MELCRSVRSLVVMIRLCKSVSSSLRKVGKISFLRVDSTYDAACTTSTRASTGEAVIPKILGLLSSGSCK